MLLHQWRYVFAAFMAVVLLLTGCAPQFVTVTVTTPPETVVVTATPSPTSASTLLPPEPKVLTVCLAREPDTLYLYGGSRLSATRHVMEALYDGPIDYLNYDYRPVILQKVPSIADGDAVTRTVRVREGDRVVDAEGGVLELAEGVRVHPAGCYADECAVEFEGEALWMERMEVTFALREDVTWAGGEPLTADDSVFAFQVASDPATPSSHYLIARTASYRSLNRWYVKWVGLPGFISPTYFLNFFAPLPRHQLEGRSPAELLQADETRRRPVGWGPFVVEEWIAGDHITLSPNPHYFRAAEGLPYLDQVVFRFTSGGPDMVARILSGECDVATQDAGFESFMSLLVQAERHGLLKVVSATSNGWEHIDFGIAPVSDYRQADFFGDVRVRQAVVQCIDRQAIVDEVTYGHSIVPDSYLPPGHPLYAGDSLVHWDYDPAAGRVLLEEVGWLDENVDGVREARRVRGVRVGTPFEITLLIPADSAITQQTARIIKANLADCGIRVNVESLFQWEFFADGPDGPLFGRQFDLAETTWWFDIIPSCGHYMSSEIPGQGRWYGDNPAGYSNPDYDEVCQAALQALPGTQQYEEYHKQAQVIFSEELPAIPLFMWLRVALAQPRVLNFVLDSTAQSELWNVEMWDLQETSP
ncbi:MAG: peptide ABC transporter substrate-binding protein [Chloroflexota bacterium]|nr:peptide ABC transporter substrate-binding protein [Chloroflexota bacterium]